MRLEDIFDVSEVLAADEDGTELAEEEMDLETGKKIESEDEEPEEEIVEEEEAGCEECEEDEGMTEEEKQAFFNFVFASDDEVDDYEMDVEDSDSPVEGDDELDPEVDMTVEEEDTAPIEGDEEMIEEIDDLGDDLGDDDDEVEAADMSSYTQSPTSIEPGTPIPTSYYGPGPDAGLNIASFYCPECADSVDVGTINPITAETVFCPVCATNMIYTADANEERIASLYDEYDDGTLIAAGICPQHGEILTDTIEAGADSYCPFCGQVLVANTSDVVPDITAKVLADPMQFKDLVPSDVTMALSGAQTENPVWHIIVKNEPVAQIRYASFQEVYASGEDTDPLAIFASNDYQKSLTDAICQMGLMDVLKTQRAELYTAAVDDSLKFEQFKTAAAVEAQAQYREKVASVVDRFSRCFQLTTDGMEKGAYDSTLGNPLVRAVAQKLQACGVPNYQAHAQAAVKAGMPSHIANMFGQTLKYLEMDDEALTHIASHFDSVNFASPALAGTDDSQASLQDHLVSTSMPLVATDSMAVPTAALPTAGGDRMRDNYKQMLRRAHSRRSGR